MKRNACLVTGQEIKRFGSREKLICDGVHTNVGPIHKDSLKSYDQLFRQAVEMIREFRSELPQKVRFKHLRREDLAAVKLVKLALKNNQEIEEAFEYYRSQFIGVIEE